jgi:hypothetical protein
MQRSVALAMQGKAKQSKAIKDHEFDLGHGECGGVNKYRRRSS